MHVFLDAGMGDVLAFFELPNQPEMGRDPNTPAWVRHIAFRVRDRTMLLASRDHLVAQGVEVLGVTDHGMFHSIYFFDPNGHRVELACPEEEAMIAHADAVKWQMLEEWSHTKRAPTHASFLHAAVAHPGSGGGDAHHLEDTLAPGRRIGAAIGDRILDRKRARLIDACDMNRLMGREVREALRIAISDGLKEGSTRQAEWIERGALVPMATSELAGTVRAARAD